MNKIALIDGDILRYEIGFGAEGGWKVKRETEEIPPFEYVEGLLNLRLENIKARTECNDYCIFFSFGKCFRYDIAKTKPYKGTRIVKKPWHFDNLSIYMMGTKDFQMLDGYEADDLMAIEALRFPEKSVICSRDKDLRQVPVTVFSWELGRQPEYGPVKPDTNLGWLELNERQQLKGAGFLFFCAQLLMGDVVDNIPGLASYGPITAYTLLKDAINEVDALEIVEREYQLVHPNNWEEMILEQGQLLWVVRRIENEKPVLWQRGMIA